MHKILGFNKDKEQKPKKLSKKEPAKSKNETLTEEKKVE